MSEREKHSILRKKEFHIPDIGRRIFNEEEQKLLRKYGSWMEGLHSGQLNPITEKQKDFVLCLKSNTPPQDI